MVTFTNIRPLPRDVEEKALRDLCVLYVCALNPEPPPPETGRITRRCRHCERLFQAKIDGKPELFCPECR